MAKKVSTFGKNNKRAYAYLAPALTSIIILSILPMIYSVFLAFTDYGLSNLSNGYGTPDGWHMVGFYQFKQILVGPLKGEFFPLLTWTIIYALISTLGCFFIGLIFAMILSDENLKEGFIYKALLVIPWALPGAIIIIAFKGLFNSEYGAINGVLQSLHIIKEPIMWLVSPHAARLAVIFLNLWLGYPYMMNICIGALAAIPSSYYEAADIDGATGIQKFFKITLPSLARTAYPLLISSFAFNFNNFNTAFLLTDGGPAKEGASFSGWTDIIGSAAYNMSTKNGQFALGSAMSILIFIIIGTISFVNMKASGQFEEVEG
ncbi:MAG: sugar ABC transporter permease [Inconstantimicrobium porci]|uniref:Maltose/maltodextrin transport system permease protein n=1 Tax=Inconstantimicrobium porci TaxID=2652291 RepID=A0A7X2T339_9CLOT|nr:sugar ABC transporter permease [Inconstantimicrobium porci]MDD6770065.1 sugar ABC transporter permease [Inconstantimicrobium porci]MDY5910486.1 sugar ABC transporter permease [Inconstantimicrobium porci]MSR92613.1 sugar ABC transporter permease [Inconstantimicrobium porci]